jgi:hypothetical protein
MATYLELPALATDSNMILRTRVACIVAAEAIRTELETVPLHTQRIQWAKGVFSNPEYEASRMLWALLARYKDLTPAQILAADDATLQAAVDEAVNVFLS